jgi:L-threonylcarbamoyladenylate synthase
MILMKSSELSLERTVHKSVEILRAGGIVAYPTETFYALGVKFDMEESLRKLYAIKQRPLEKAMPLIIGHRELLSMITSSINRSAVSLMDRFWPGPLTLIFPALAKLSDYITAGTHTVAVRIPGESFAFQLAKSAQFPLTATSANISGRPPARDAETVIEYFNDTIDLIIDGGKTPGGMPSTIVDVTGETVRILREGIIKKENMAAYIMPGLDCHTFRRGV